MQWWVLLALSGCGRLGFDEPDAGVAIDARVDADTDAPLDPGLIVWYKMDDDPSDGQLVDSAGGDHVAVCLPGLSCGTTAPGPRGQALQLAPEQFYRLPFEGALNMPSRFTVALWVRPAAAGPMVVFTKRFASVHNSWAIKITAADRVAFESARPGPGVENAEAVPTLSLGAWIHVAVTWDDTTKRIYLGGVRLIDDIPTDIAFDTGEVLLGCDEDAGARFSFVKGLVDDVRIYDRVLNDTEIGVLAQP